MSATRLLVLGVVRQCGTAHGYRVRAELVAWGAEEWANIKWGSLYHALRQFAKEGLMIATPAKDTPGRTDYSLTTSGETEFHRLLRDALRRPEHRPDTLGAALALLPALTREEAITLLTERLRTLETERTEKAKLAELGTAPGTEHLRELPRLWEHTARGGIEWTQGLLHRLRSGTYAMTNDNTHTTPP
ncbi:PadR family transcriptional regulator [Actinoalloteichus caeruleus]|uniref:PadR family transcriptional regulator n=1 Tax=Actinoalloteichus cyanogriseus TaxID=2893586 RepID=UPI0004AA32D1|nr:helix-turn-helix transcriptional regulator [Actinoalloteichus caeruleus]